MRWQIFKNLVYAAVITIVSSDMSHRAYVTPSGEGVTVALWRVHPPRRRLGVWVFEQPLHVVLDNVHELLRPLAVEGPLRVYDNDLQKVVLTTTGRTPGVKT